MDKSCIGELQIGLIEKVFNGRYEVCRTLGSGGMSAVLLVEGRQPNQNKYALKLISKTTAADEADAFTEVQILTDLKHPAIPKVYEVREDDDYIYIIQDYIRGRTLAEIRDSIQPSSDPDTELTRKWMLEIAEAMKYLHERGIIHRDIKPGNIMIDNEGSAKLIDFGIARRLSSISRGRYKSTTGSAPYSPLERLQGKPDGIYTDIYAFGTSFYSLLCKSVPDVSSSELNRLRSEGKSVRPYYMNAYKKMAEDVRNINDPELQKLVRSCIKLRPGSRIRNYNKRINEMI